MHLFRVNFTMKLTYQTHPFDDDDIRGVDSESNETRDHAEGETTNRSQWDDDCPWSEWYSAEDPVKGELVSKMYLFFSFLSEILYFLFIMC